MINTEDSNRLWSMIEGIKVGMLVSRDGDHLHARPMHLVQGDFDGTLWFFTARDSGKTQEAAEESSVCVTFADHGTETYVSLTGTSSLNRDRAKIDQFWTPFVGAYFPQGKDDPNLTLLEIRVDGAEYWDAESSRMVQLFKFAKANLTHQPPQMGEHRKIGNA